MALNHILYRPQILDRPLGDSDERLLEELMELVSRMLSDSIKGAPALAKMQAGIQEAMDNLIQEVKSRIVTTGKELMKWLAPILQAIQLLANSMGNLDTSSTGVHTLAHIILFLADVVEGLSAEAIETKLNGLLHIITDDLGLSKERMLSFLNEAVDTVVQKMKADFLAGNHSEQSHNEYLIGTYLEKIKRLSSNYFLEIDFELDLASLAAPLIKFLKNLDWERLRATAQQILEDVGNTVESLAILMDIFSGKFNVTVTVTVDVNAPHPENDPVSWYASWFQQDFCPQDVVGVIDRANMEDEDFFPTMSFKQDWLGLSVMEDLAHWSDVSSDALQTVLHAKSAFSVNDYLGNMINGSTHGIRALITTLIAKNNERSWVDAYNIISNWVYELIGTATLSLFSGTQGMHWETGEHRWIFWFTLVGKDFTEALLYSNWTARLRQGLLSFLTLLNSDPVGQPNSENHNKVVGFSMVFSELLSWIAASLTGRKNFGFPAHGGPWPFIFHWAGGIAGGWLGGVAGWLLSWAVNASQLPEGTDADVAKPNRKSFDLMSLESLVTSLLKHPVYNYLIWSGDTDGGKFGLDRLRTYRTFKGYPPKETSPYFLPYPAGSVRQCAQGNLGPWSHNGNTNQIYAYDWDHDHWMDVLCVRAGTVMDWSDVMPDHSTFIQNEIEIKHDRTPPDPIHDRDWQEEPVETTAGYLHGAHYSIRHVFAAIGIPKENIIGTPVDQGSLVMLSGDTGMSFYNHLHMHISSPGAQTIPWVFRDEDAPDNGVLNDLTWYESSNVPALGPTDLAIARPPEQESLLHYKNAALISASGKTLEIDVYVGQSNRGIGVGSYTFDDDFFKGLVLKISKPGGGFQYQRITGSEIPSGSVQFKVENTLNPVPTRGPSTAITIECLAGKTTSNTILLDGYAREQNDTYSGRFILVWWETEDGSTAYQYKKIEDYDTGDRKVTIEGNWDRQPPEFSHYEIGGLPHADSSDFYRKFAYIPGGTSAAPARHLHNTAKSHKASVTGQPDLGGASNQLILASGTSLDPADVIGRSIAIYDINPVNSFARIIAYGFATAYVKATRTVTMANDWAVPFTSINYYEIGSPQYNNASTTQEERNEFAFICPDNDPNTYSPKDFGSPNPGKPYTSQTFKTWM